MFTAHCVLKELWHQIGTEVVNSAAPRAAFFILEFYFQNWAFNLSHDEDMRMRSSFTAIFNQSHAHS